MRFALLALIAVLPLSAQPFPDAAGLFERDSAALGKYLSYRFTVDMSMDMTVSGMAVKMTSTGLVQGLNPGKYRIESNSSDTGSSVVVSDGRFTWTYAPARKQYTRKESGGGGVLKEMAGLGLTADDDRVAANGKVIRSETLEVDGQAHDCWVVESRIGSLLEKSKMKFSDGVWTTWLDKALGLDLQDTLSAKLQAEPLPAPMEVRMKIARHDLKFNESLPDSLFVFTPPPDATETAEPGLGGAMLRAEPAGRARQTGPSPRTLAAADGEPQAYVPNLNPEVRVEPVYPPAARSQGLQGMVHVLVTLDLAGHVTQAEALGGREILRPAALDAVRQWSFRPVLRDGHPVYAYTDVTVDFDLDDPARPAKPGDADLAGEMAAAQRIAELRERMPRSPEQILADTEQQAGAASGIERFYALAGLAKAAIDAGQPDKAATYATELLQLAELHSHDWNYGNAIHDGNLVLGLVALRSDDIAGAKTYLLAAGKTPGSPQLNSFGPNMKLAKALLEKGERDAVLEYFSLCRTFWKLGGARLDSWSAAVRSGVTPDFGANLLF